MRLWTGAGATVPLTRANALSGVLIAPYIHVPPQGGTHVRTCAVPTEPHICARMRTAVSRTPRASPPATHMGGEQLRCLPLEGSQPQGWLSFFAGSLGRPPP